MCNCSYCKLLKTPYEILFIDPKYEGIIFLKIYAEEHQIAKHYVIKKDMPFVIIYNNGYLVECDTVRTVKELEGMLERLLLHKKSNGNIN